MVLERVFFSPSSSSSHPLEIDKDWYVEEASRLFRRA